MNECFQPASSQALREAEKTYVKSNGRSSDSPPGIERLPIIVSGVLFDPLKGRLTAAGLFRILT